MLCVMTTAFQVTANKRKTISHFVAMIVFHVQKGSFQTRKVGETMFILMISDAFIDLAFLPDLFSTIGQE